MRGVFASIIAGLFASAVMAQTPPAAAPPAAPVLSDADKTLGVGKVIGLDYFYNHQFKAGVQFHYVWEDKANSGFSKFGDVWQSFGASLAKLEKAPTLDDLKKFSVYIICNPNTPAKALDGKPNYIGIPDGDAIEQWVKDGGVLALFANDQKNSGCEFEHFDTLSSRFGITYNNVLRNEVPNARDRKPGTFTSDEFSDHPIFKDISMIYMKEICTITISPPAQAILTVPKEKAEGDGTDVVMAVSHVGKGLVFAVCDPWVYNEYIDVVSTPGLKLENRKGAVNLARFLLSAASAPQAK
jgi:unsaturated rhamnogalacturonyl hydrolase